MENTKEAQQFFDTPAAKKGVNFRRRRTRINERTSELGTLSMSVNQQGVLVSKPNVRRSSFYVNPLLPEDNDKPWYSDVTLQVVACAVLLVVGFHLYKKYK